MFLIKRESVITQVDNLIAGKKNISTTFDKLHIHVDIVGLLQHLAKTYATTTNGPIANIQLGELVEHWVTRYPEDFIDSYRKQLLTNVANVLPFRSRTSVLRSLSEIPDETSQTYHTKGFASFDRIFTYDHKVIAANFTNIDADHFASLKPSDIDDYLAYASNTASPVFQYIRKMENISLWTASAVLCKEDASCQASTLAVFCQLLAHLYQIKSYNILFYILAGLDKYAVQRLASAWKLLPERDLSNYDIAEDFCSVANDYASYRQKVTLGLQFNQHISPIFPLLLKEIKSGSIGSDILHQFQALRIPASLVNHPLQNFINDLPALPEEELNHLSRSSYAEDASTYSSQTDKPSSAHTSGSSNSTGSRGYFSYDKVVSTSVDHSTVTSGSGDLDDSDWDDLTFSDSTSTEVASPSKKKKSILPWRKVPTSDKYPNSPRSNGLYGVTVSVPPKPKLKVGTVNKYGYTFLCKVTDLKKNSGIKVKVGKQHIGVFYVNNEAFVMDDDCCHKGVPLHVGEIEDYHGEPCVKCPGHGFKFNLATGECNIKRYTQPVYKSRVRENYVWALLTPSAS